MAITPAAAPVSANVIWKGSGVKNWREVEQVTLSGVIEAGAFRPTAVAPAQPSAPAMKLLAPIGANILPLADIRPFGREERVEMHEGLIRCRPGKAPAGLLLRWPDRRLPKGYDGHWRLEGQAQAAIGVTAVPAQQDAPTSPAAIWRAGPVTAPLADGRGEQMLVLTCPAVGGSARLDGVTLLPSARSLPGARGTWIWQERDWHGDPIGFARRAAAAGWTELAIQTPAAPDAALVGLSAALAEHGIAFRLLDGDPVMATPGGRAEAERRFARLRRWCADHLTACPVLELDIEPYALPGFAADPGAGWKDWAESIRAIAQAWGGPVAIDVPWWMRRSPEASAHLDEAAASIAEIVVMAYRTDPQLILDAAESWLDAAGPPVRLAIESGPVAEEATRLYRRAASGTLRLSDAGAELLSGAEAAGPADALFTLVQESRTDPARISFHGAPARALEVERAIVPLLAGWPRFAGFRIHGWDARDKKTSDG